MNCPLCGSEIANGVKYCPVCGADIEAAQRRSAGLHAQWSDQTRRMPPMQDQTAPRAAGQRPSRAAVPMNSSMPQQRGQQPQAMRNFDTSKMGGTPKWPIVLIVVLILVIIAALVLIIFQPWKTPTQQGTTQATTSTSQQADVPVTSVDAGATNTDAPATEPAPTPDQPAQPTGLSNADAFTQLTDLYNQLSGYNDRIGSVAEDFNSMYLSDDLAARQASLANAQGVQSEIADRQATLDAMQLAEGSAYVDTLATMKTLYSDLANRIRVLVDAWNASVAAGDNPAAASDEISSILGADNGEGGVNRYKAEYDELYPSSAPVQVA